MTRPAPLDGRASAAAAIVVMAAYIVMATASQPDAGSLRAATMRAHFGAVVGVHDAIARGELPDAARRARALADQRPEVPFPPGASAFFTLMQMAARDVAAAPTLEEAARATAVLLTRCGECHDAEHVAPRVSRHLGTAAIASPAMRDHQQGADLLWVGLVEPSDAAWLAGAEAYARLRVPREAMPDRESDARALIADARLTGLAAEAAGTVRPPDRARVYGRVLSTCARCHEAHGVKPRGPDRAPR